MRHSSSCLTAACLLAAVAMAGLDIRPSTRYEDLVALFSEWRAFQKPKLQDGVPDYTARAMAAQREELGAFQRRLAAIDPAGWPVTQQVDYSVVRAEMNGLEFDHRVLKAWANNPAFYVTVFTEESDQPAREGPFAAGPSSSGPTRSRSRRREPRRWSRESARSRSSSPRRSPTSSGTDETSGLTAHRASGSRRPTCRILRSGWEIPRAA